MKSALRKKRYLLPAAFILFFLLLVLAPFIISTSPVLGLVTSVINSRVPGTLTVQSWLVGWQQGILCQNIEYLYPERGVRVSASRLTTTRGLLELIMAPRNLGTMILESPVLVIDRAAQPGPVTETGREAEQVKANDTRPVWDRLAAELQVRNGTVKMMASKTGDEVGIRDISLNSRLEGGIIDLSLEFKALTGPGNVRAEGKINLPGRSRGWLDTMITELELVVKGYQLEDLLSAAAASSSSIPAGQGELEAGLGIKMVGIKALEVSGDVLLRELKLRGGFLGEDAPSFRQLGLKIDGGDWSGRGWQCKGFEFTADTGYFQGQGHRLDQGTVLVGKGSINLPVLFEQFPHLLHVQQEVLLESGTFDFGLEFTRNSELTDLELASEVKNIGGYNRGRSFAWDAPVTALFKGGEEKGAFLVKALRIEAPFFQADGRGDPHSFVLDVSADLQEGFREAARLFQLEWNGGGRLEMTLKGGNQGIDNARIGFEADLNISDFSLNRSDQLYIPRQDLSLVGSGLAPLALLHGRPGKLDLQLALSSWLGDVFLTLDGEKRQDKPFRGYYSTDSNFNLDSATKLLQACGKIAGDLSVNGEMLLQAAGYMDRDKLEFREFEAGILGLTIDNGSGTIIEEKKMRLAARPAIKADAPFLTLHELIVAETREEFFTTGAGVNLLDFSGRRLFLHHLTLTSRTADMRIDKLLVPDWRRPLEGLAAGAQGRIDLQLLTRWLQGAEKLSADTLLGGRLTFDLAAGGGGEKRRWSTAVQVDDFSLRRLGKEMTAGPNIAFAADIQGDLPGGSFVIDKLQVDSGLLTIAATGRTEESALREVQLQGTIQPDLAQIAVLLREGFNLDIDMSGSQEEAFFLQLPLTRDYDQLKGRARVESRLSADRLIFRGIDLHTLTLPFGYQQGKLHFEATGALNGGELFLVADSDLTLDPALIKIPEKTRVLIDVGLERPLIENLLASIHPLFGVMAEPSGHFDLRFDSFVWQIGEGEKDKGAFVGVFDLQGVSLESTGVLREILDVVGLGREPLSLADNELYCIGSKGRISCSPVRIAVAGSEIVISGSVLDNKLDYLVEVPITAKSIAGQDASLPEGLRIKVPVTGTLKEPVINRPMIENSLQDLLRLAGGNTASERKNVESLPDAGQTAPGLE